MFDTLTRIYKKTKDKTYLENAVKRGWLDLILNVCHCGTHFLL